MPRHSRVVLPGYPHHIVQRGHNRQPIFFSDEDYLFYLENLIEFKRELECRLYGYCLMTNHVHLIIDPGPEPENLGKLMKRVAARQTRYVNRLDSRSGTLWEGRYKSSPIDTNEYLLACCRYVEMNPVRAGMVADPLDYRWSSHAELIGRSEREYVDLSPRYQGLGSNAVERQEKYRDVVINAVPEVEARFIRDALQRGQLTGGNKFVDDVEARIKSRIETRGQGRPRKARK